MNKKVVVYHENCTDGMCSACVIAKKFQEQYSNGDIEFVGGQYNNEDYYLNNIDWHNKEVYIVDFGFTEETLLKIAKKAKNVIMLDHHKTMWYKYATEEEINIFEKHFKNGLADLKVAKIHKKLSDNCEVLIDLTKSGSLVAWNYFFNEPVPQIVKSVSDGDLYQFKYAETKGFLSYLSLQEQSLDSYLNIINLSNKEIEDILSKGELLSQLYESICQDVAKRATMVEFHLKDENGNILSSHKGGFIACSGEIKSRVGEIIYEKTGTFALILNDMDNDNYRFSLRSSNQNQDLYDVRLIAEHFGGGGHDTAAAFTVSKKIWDENCNYMKEQRKKLKV